MIYVIVDSDGVIVSSHNDETITELPEGAIELQEAQWGDRLEYRYLSGQRLKIEKAQEEQQ